MKHLSWNSLTAGGIYAFAAVAPFSNAGMELVIGYLAIVWIAYFIFGGGKGAKQSHKLFQWDFVTGSIIMYLIVMVIAGAVSARPIQSILAVKEEWIILLYFSLVTLLPSRQVFLRALYVLAISCTIVGIYAVVQHFTGINFPHDEPLLRYGNFFRSGGFFGFCLTFGGFILMVFSVLLGSFYGAEKLRSKVLFGISSAVTFLAAVASYARSIWLGAIIGSLVASIVIHWKTGIKYIAVIGLFCAGIYFFHPELIREHGVTSMIDPNYSKGSRIRVELWQKTLEMWKDHPALGIGPGNFPYYQNNYAFSESARGLTHPHNDLLNVAVQTGIIGLTAFIGIWAAFIWSCYRFWRRERKHPEYSGLTAGAVLGCGGAIIGILSAGMFQCYYTDIEVGMIWWYIAGLASAVISLPQEVSIVKGMEIDY